MWSTFVFMRQISAAYCARSIAKIWSKSKAPLLWHRPEGLSNAMTCMIRSGRLGQFNSNSDLAYLSTCPSSASNMITQLECLLMPDQSEVLASIYSKFLLVYWNPACTNTSSSTHREVQMTQHQHKSTKLVNNCSCSTLQSATNWTHVIATDTATIATETSCPPEMLVPRKH